MTSPRMTAPVTDLPSDGGPCDNTDRHLWPLTLQLPFNGIANELGAPPSPRYGINTFCLPSA